MSRPRRFRVLHAVPDLEYGGLQRLIVDLVERTDPSRFEVQVLVFGSIGPLGTRISSTATVHQVGLQTKASMVWPRAVTHQIRSIRPDVVHSHSGVWYKASLAAKLAGVPWIVHTDHGRQSPDPWLSRAVDRLASKRTNVVVAVSDRLAREVSRIVANPSRVRVVINGVDTELHCPGRDRDLRAELRLGADAVVLGSIGRLESIKGYDLMVEALARRQADGPPVVLLVAGDGSERHRLEALAVERGVDHAIRFLGWRDDLARLHATFDVFVLTSRSEGTSVSLLEAMSSGICPVVTDVGGNASVLGPSLRHLLVAAGDPAAIAAGWEAVIRDRAARVAAGGIARRRVEAEFGLGGMVRAYEAIYEEGSRSIRFAASG